MHACGEDPNVYSSTAVTKFDFIVNSFKICLLNLYIYTKEVRLEPTIGVLRMIGVRVLGMNQWLESPVEAAKFCACLRALYDLQFLYPIILSVYQ